MNSRALTLSLVMAGVAVLFVQSYVSSIEEQAKKNFGTELNVLVAKKEIGEMETLNDLAWEVKPMPKRFIEPGAITFTQEKVSEEEAKKSLKGLAGSVALVPIKKGEQITFNKLTEPGARTGLAPQVAPGRRAVAIPVSETSGVSKLVKPGDRVDVVAVIDPGVGREYKISKVVLQDVVVLSVGRNVTNNIPRLVENDAISGKERVRSLTEDSSYNTVTLEVEPGQVQTVALLTGAGDTTLFLSLRHNDDSERVNTPSVMMVDVLGGDASRVRRTPSAQGGGGR